MNNNIIPNNNSISWHDVGCKITLKSSCLKEERGIGSKIPENERKKIFKKYYLYNYILSIFFNVYLLFYYIVKNTRNYKIPVPLTTH